MPLLAGDRLGVYEIRSQLGAGGMGVVYRARDDKLGRDVAIKVLPDDLVESRERLDRFEREARLLAQLNHTNIATLHGLEEHDGQPFLVMELVEGETLEERIARGPLPIEEAVLLFVQIAEGLEAAHERGIIHRDLKPANIKVTPGDNVKILDFGLAKAFVAECGSADSSRSPTLTRGTALGAILGTAAYMSPEQAKGKRVDTRADVWAFGACLFEALSRQRAFPGDTVAETLANVIAKEPRWEKLPADVPQGVRRLLRRTLVKNAKERLQHIGDARVELTAMEMAAELVPGRTRSQRRLWAVAGFLAGAIALWVTRPPDPPKPVLHMEVTTEPRHIRLQENPVISPDGETIAYDKLFRSGIILRSLTSPIDTPLTGAADGGNAPFFSNDGEWIGYFTRNTLWKIRFSGGAPVRICDFEGIGPRAASWVDDGTIVFSDGAGPLLSVSENGGTPRALTTLDVESYETGHWYPHVLPEGRGVLFEIHRGGPRSIGIFDFETGAHRELVENGAAPLYSASGHLLFARDGAIHAAGFDLEDLRLTTDPVTVVNRVLQWPMYGTRAQYHLSDNGTLVYASMDDDHAQTERTLVWLDSSGRVLSERSFDELINDTAVSPDGERVAITVNSIPPKIWIVERARETRTPLTFEDGAYPVWSPDGERVAFLSSRHGGKGNVYWKLADGTGATERLTTNPMSYQFPMSFSPDGGHLVFDETEKGGIDIFVHSIDSDREPIAFANQAYVETGADFSPDGRWIAYTSRRAGSNQIYVSPFPGPGEAYAISMDGGRSSRWSADGKTIFYAQDDWMMAADVTTDPVVRASKPRRVFELDPYVVENYVFDVKSYDVTPDGGFVMIREDRSPEPTRLRVVLNWDQELKRLVPTP